DDAERREQLLDQVVLFVVERRAAERRDRERAVERLPVLLVLPRLRARRDDAVGDHVHRVLERQRLPRRSMGWPVLDAILAQRALDEVLRRRALRAEAPARDRALRVALDLRDLPVLDEDQLAAPDGSLRT